MCAPLADADREVAVFAYLGAGGDLVGVRHVGEGERGAITVMLRSVAADTLAFDARAVLMAHNHPGGEPYFSRDDIAVTRRIAIALEALGVRLVDHLVIARTGFASLSAAGLI